MTALRKPSKYAGLQQFDYSLGDVPLTCWLEFEKGEPATWGYHGGDPGYPDNASLWYAEHCGEDITEILSDEQKEKIETAFLEQETEY
jgi:hypothetical protein